jgi:hypothetical protein
VRAAAAASREERLRTLDHGGQAQSRSALCAFQSGLATILHWTHLSQALKLGQTTKHGTVDSNGPGRALGQGTKHIHSLKPVRLDTVLILGGVLLFYSSALLVESGRPAGESVPHPTTKLPWSKSFSASLFWRELSCLRPTTSRSREKGAQ